MPLKKSPSDNNEDDVVIEPTEEETGEENLREKLKNAKEKLEICLKEKTEYLSGWQRAKADYINLQKESESSRSEAVKIGAGRVISEILPVLDSFNMAMGNKETWEAVPANWRTGVEYIANQLKTALSNNGLSEICPKEKDDVNFQYHAVVETVPTGDETLDGKISDVLQNGYAMGEKVIRPARVRVFAYGK